jgi:type 1 glutamine amidotransferase
MTPLRTLVLCDDQWHPGTDVRRGLNALADAVFAFEFVASAGGWSAVSLSGFPLAIVAKANHLSAADPRPWLTQETQGAIREFVRRGGGLFLIHGGTCYKDLPEMRGLTGGAFLNHPAQCPVTVEPKAGHTLTAGVATFTAQDEHYLMALEAADADVFLHTRSGHGVQPAGWTRTEGSGRVCVLTPGHNAEVWLHPEFQKLLRNGLNWLANGNA